MHRAAPPDGGSGHGGCRQVQVRVAGDGLTISERWSRDACGASGSDRSSAPVLRIVENSRPPPSLSHPGLPSPSPTPTTAPSPLSLPLPHSLYLSPPCSPLLPSLLAPKLASAYAPSMSYLSLLLLPPLPILRQSDFSMASTLLPIQASPFVHLASRVFGCSWGVDVCGLPVQSHAGCLVSMALVWRLVFAKSGVFGLVWGTGSRHRFQRLPPALGREGCTEAGTETATLTDPTAETQKH